jgi:hypothetical protein
VGIEPHIFLSEVRASNRLRHRFGQKKERERERERENNDDDYELPLVMMAHFNTYVRVI